MIDGPNDICLFDRSHFSKIDRKSKGFAIDIESQRLLMKHSCRRCTKINIGVMDEVAAPLPPSQPR